MQDLMSDGQCPFSPPRAPPHGFPHFLFAAAQQNASPMEDPASALLRERTIMALDSFLQQQQHLQSSGSPNQRAGPAQQPQGAGPPLQPPPPLSQHSGQQSFGSGGQSAGFANFMGAAPAGQAANLEQLIMQQQHFAAAMAAAAAASGAHHPLQGLFGPLGPPPPANPALSRRSPSCNTPTSQMKAGAPVSPQQQQVQARNCQQSPIGAPKEQFHSSPLGGAPNPFASSNYTHNHLQAVMAAHHQHQMAALSQMQQQQHHQMADNQQTCSIGQRNIHLNQREQQQLDLPDQDLAASGKLFEHRKNFK